MLAGDAFGLHRVLLPPGSLPQAAERLDADASRRFEHEMHIEVDTLHVDSASMRQLEEESGGNAQRVGERIAGIVEKRGKLHNPVTGSGGMLLGRVAWMGPQSGFPLAPGDRIATLVSLTLTPLAIRKVKQVRLSQHQVDIEGTAILFSSGSAAKLPADLSEHLALSILDVAGAAPQVLRLAAPGHSVLILGCGGKSGLLCAAAARRAVGPGGLVLGVENHERAAAAARALGHCSTVLAVDAAKPVLARAEVLAACPPALHAAGGFDLVVSCVNVPDAEMTAILLTRDRGRVYFFSMATSFTRAALGAEGISRDIDMLIGNGYSTGHAEATMKLLREEPALRAELERRSVTK